MENEFRVPSRLPVVYRVEAEMPVSGERLAFRLILVFRSVFLRSWFLRS